ncbi:glycoside hydrolase family 32 protein [Sporolactobacillus sp. THM7-4]|nr:glycoside hydrolase family 32 protein [Sporolactobacillus sp. THM7-4]
MKLDQLTKANEALQAAEKSINPRYRLGYHIMAPANWINDPNGLVQFRGEYHAFYQHHPYGVDWGPMHWGHVKSKDLVHWEHLPIALSPGDPCDREGCFSGSAVVNNGELNLIYTGHRFADEGKTVPDEVQCRAFSKDGIHFEKDVLNPVIPRHPDVGSGDFRDPKVWKHGDYWYLVAGTSRDKIGKVVLYKSSDLRHWDYQGVLAESDGAQGYMWECPDFYQLDGKYVLMFSPQGIEPSGDLYRNLYQTGYLVGDYDYETNTFKHGGFTELDHGHDFYAVQSFEDARGRRIAIGWMDMWESPMPEKNDGWAGALTLPRELHLDPDGKIRMTPVDELKQLRKKELVCIENELVSGSRLLPELNGELLEIMVEFDTADSAASEFGIKFRVGKTEETVIRYNSVAEKLVLDRSKSGQAVDGFRRTELTNSGRLKLHIYLDRSSVEVFADDGKAVMTSRIYPTEENRGTQLFATGGSVKVMKMRVWELEDIWNGQK